MVRMSLAVIMTVTPYVCVCDCVPQAEGQEVASVVSTQEIRVVAELLLVSPEGLEKSVTFKLTVSGAHFCRNSPVHTPQI